MALSKSPTPRPLDNGLEFHIFISHCQNEAGQKDVEAAGILRKELQDAGYKCCDTENDFIGGKPVDVNISECINKSKKVILIVSKVFLESTFFSLEVGLALMKEGKTKQVTLIPIVTDVAIEKLPSSIRRLNVLQWQPDSKPFWERLQKTLEVEELSALIPAGNIAHGLAWSYFYGYLNLVLPGMCERVEKAKQEDETFKKLKDIPFLDKMMIILPDSGFCPPDLKDDDPNIQHVGYIHFKASRAGNVNRDYKSSVYKVTSPSDNKDILVIAEFATPLMSMYEMEKGELAGLNPEEKLAQKRLFEDKLMEILTAENNAACHNTFNYLSFEDPRDDKMKPKGWSLSAKMAEKAFREVGITERVKSLRINH